MTIIITALCAFAFGAADQYLGSRSALGPWASSASLMSAPWLLVAFVAGLTQDRPRRAMVLGLLATVAALVGYFAMTYSPLEIHPWSLERFTTGVVAIASTGYNPAYILTGLMTGPLFGLLGQRWRVHRSWVSAAIVAGVLCLEPVALLLTGQLSYRSTAVWRVELAAGTVAAVLFALAIRARKQRGAAGTKHVTARPPSG